MKRISSVISVCAALSAVTVGATPARAQGLGCAGADTRYQPGANEAQMRAALLCLVNNERTVRGLSRLAEVDTLNVAAERHAQDMASRGYFNHVAPDPAPYGAWPNERAQAAGYPFGVPILEDIYFGRSQTDPRDATPRGAVSSWMASTGHCNAILAYAHVDFGSGLGTYVTPPLMAGQPDMIWHNWVIEMAGGTSDDYAEGCPFSTLVTPGSSATPPPPPVGPGPPAMGTTPTTGTTLDGGGGSNPRPPSDGEKGASLRGSSTLTVRRRAIALRLRCLRVAGTCHGTAIVRTKTGTYIGRATVRIAARATKAVRVSVRRSALKGRRTSAILTLDVDGTRVVHRLTLRR